MKIQKVVVLTGLVALALAAAAPGSASAAVWKHGGEPLTEFVELQLGGGEIFETGTSGMSCKVHATLATEGGSEGQITKFKILECPTGFGEMKACSLVTAEAKGLPWTVHVNATDLTISGMHTRRTFSSGCPIKELDKTITSTTVTLQTPAAITSMEFRGEATGYKTFGSLSVEGANSGTYGIG